MELSVIEAELKSLLDNISNGKPVSFTDQMIEELGEQVKQSVRKQLTPRDPEFRVRASNVGRNLCVLQKQKEGAEAEPMPYNHVVRMLIGDCVEAIVRLLLDMTSVQVTSDGDKVELDVSGVSIKGESDIDIDGKVYDIKSCSPFAFKNKWSLGYAGLKEDDSFGYVGQMYLYADAQKKEPGGWIVVDKSSGEISVVEVEDNPAEAEDVRQDRKYKVEAIDTDQPFRRGFELQDEYFRRKATGDKVLHKNCGFCNFKKSCWPTVTRRPSKMSNPEAKSPTFKWFVD
jgi:hypothetical protein